jgi:hypothetical protein
LNRLPEYEKFIALWPREDSILAPLVYSMLSPFELDRIFQPRPAGMSEYKFGTCLLNWVQINAPYDEQHADDFKLNNKNIIEGTVTDADLSPSRQHRNPLEILFSIRRGVCGELSLTLAGILQNAGYSPDHILLANYDMTTQLGHLDLAVKMFRDESPPEAAFLFVNGEKYYIMDPAVYVYGKNNQLQTRWGDTPYKGAKDAAIRPLNGN